MLVTEYFYLLAVVLRTGCPTFLIHFEPAFFQKAYSLWTGFLKESLSLKPEFIPFFSPWLYCTSFFQFSPLSAETPSIRDQLLDLIVSLSVSRPFCPPFGQIFGHFGDGRSSSTSLYPIGCKRHSCMFTYAFRGWRRLQAAFRFLPCLQIRTVVYYTQVSQVRFEGTELRKR